MKARKFLYILFFVFFCRNGCWELPHLKGNPVPLGYIFEDYWELMLDEEMFDICIDFEIYGDGLALFQAGNSFFLLEPDGSYTEKFAPINTVLGACSPASKSIAIGTSHPIRIALSTNEGETWKVLNTPADTAARLRLLEFHPFDPSTIYFATDTSLYFTEDEGENFTLLFNFPFSSKASLCIDPPVLYFATEKTLYLSEDMGKEWEKIYETGESILDVEIGSRDEVFLLIAGVILRSGDRGKTWEQIYSGLKGYDIEPVEGGLLIAERSSDGFRVYRLEEGRWDDISLGLITYIDFEEEYLKILCKEDIYYFCHSGIGGSFPPAPFTRILKYLDTPLP